MKPDGARQPSDSVEARQNPVASFLEEAIPSPFQALIENAFDAIKVVDRDCAIIYASPSVERVLGYDPAGLVGRKTLEFIHPDDHVKAQEVLDTILQEGRRQSYSVVRSLHKNGTWRTVEFIAQDLLSDPAIRGIVLNYRDITDRLEALEALRRSEEIYHKAFRSCPDSITITYMRDGTILEANEGFEKITGFSRNEMIGKSMRKLGFWKDDTRRQELFRTLDDESRVRGFEAEFIVKGGRVRKCLISAEMVELNDEPCILAVTEDITEREKADRALRATTEKLRTQHQEATEKNIALKQILDHIDEEKAAHRHDVAARVENLLSPIVSRLRKNDGKLRKRDIEFLEIGLRKIIRGDIDPFQNSLSKLTPRELDICDLLRRGLSSKEIASKLGLSAQTVNKHRQSIRRKLQIDNKEINLASYLRSQ